MSTTLLVILTLLEIVALVVVLAIFLVILSGQLRTIASLLAQVAFGVRAVERMLSTIGTVRSINSGLDDLARMLPRVADKAESQAAARR